MTLTRLPVTQLAKNANIRCESCLQDIEDRVAICLYSKFRTARRVLGRAVWRYDSNDNEHKRKHTLGYSYRVNGSTKL